MRVRPLDEGILSRAGDTVYAFRFVRLLTQKWEKTTAFKLGVVDKDGKKLKKPSTPAEKASYTVFHRLVFNLKRLIGKIPFGKSVLASWAAALYLLKEHGNLTDDELKTAIEDLVDFDWESLKESTDSWIQTDGNLNPGTYILTEDVPCPVTGQELGFKNQKVLVEDFTEPRGYVFNTPIYEVLHILTKQKLYISIGEIKR